jgi:hypothetical protein
MVATASHQLFSGIKGTGKQDSTFSSTSYSDLESTGDMLICSSQKSKQQQQQHQQQQMKIRHDSASSFLDLNDLTYKRSNSIQFNSD